MGGKSIAARSTPKKRPLAPSLDQLKQRQTFRIAVAYTVAAWLVVQVAATILPAFNLPEWVLRAIILLSIAGFIATVSYYALLREPEMQGGWLDSKTRYWRVLAVGAVLAVLATAGTLAVRGGLLFGRQEVALAVIPFADLSPGRDKAYFAEGVAEEILSTLATEKGIKVLGRTSARQLESNLDPKAIRASLGVTHLLEGSTRTAGDQLRINVRLIDTSDGSQLWEEEYQGRLADVFAVQDQVAATVVERLRGTFFNASVPESKATAIGAYQTYLAARALMRTRSEKTLGEALELAKKVVAADPNYAPGRAMLAELLFHLSDDPYAYGRIPIGEARRLALPHAREAIRLAPSKADGYAAYGLLMPDERGIAPLRKAISLDPARAELRVWLGLLFNRLGTNDEAYSEYVKALEIEPLWPVPLNRVVQTLATSGEVEKALEVIELYRRRGGSEPQALRFLAYVRRSQGDLSESIRLGLAALQKDPGLPYVAGWTVRQLHLLGLRTQALAISQGIEGDYHRRLIAGEDEAAGQSARRDGSRFWLRPDASEGLWLVTKARDWETLVALYDRRPADFRNFCREGGPHTVAVAMALLEQGRRAESETLLNCLQRLVSFELGHKMRSPDQEPGRLEVRMAAILAVRGEKGAVDWLSRAVDAGWFGQFFSGNLADYPQFEGLRGDPRLLALQRRIDGQLKRERAETVRLLGQSQLSGVA